MTIRHALLALLTEGPKYGLRLKDEFENRTGAVWPLNVGQVYATIQRLTRDDLVAESEADGDVGQRLYELTGKGRVELDRWLLEASVEASPPREELVIKVLVALTVPGVDVSAVIQNHRRQLIETLQRYTKMKTADASMPFLMVADAEIYRCEAAVRWLDTCDARLKSVGQVPAPSDSRVSASAHGQGPAPADGRVPAPPADGTGPNGSAGRPSADPPAPGPGPGGYPDSVASAEAGVSKR